MNNREIRTRANAPVPVREYNFHEHTDNEVAFLDENTETDECILLVPLLIAFYERERMWISDTTAATGSSARLFERALSLFEDNDETLEAGKLVSLVRLATIALCETDDQPEDVLLAFLESVLKWTLRNREALNNVHLATELCACVSVAEASFRPIEVDLKLPLAVLKAATDAASRGAFLKLATQLATEGAGAAAVAPLILEAIAAPAEDLVVAGVHAAAMFLDKFGGTAGLEPNVLEGDIPNAGQRECGVSKVNVHKACRDIFDYVQSEQDARPSVNVVEPMDFAVDRFDQLYLVEQLHNLYPGSLTNVLRRSRNSVYRVCKRAFHMKQVATDRAGHYAKSASPSQQERDDEHRKQERERAHLRANRDQVLRSGDGDN